MAEERIPYLCPHDGCRWHEKPLKNIVGWKHHMTMAHEGYNDEQVNTALPIVPTPEFSVDVGAGEEPAGATAGAPARERRPRRTQAQKEFDDKVNAFISLVVETILHYTPETQAKMEATRGEMLGVVLGVHCEFEAGMITLRSVWWLILLILASYFTPTFALLGKSMRERAAARGAQRERAGKKEPEEKEDEGRIQ